MERHLAEQLRETLEMAALGSKFIGRKSSLLFNPLPLLYKFRIRSLRSGDLFTCENLKVRCLYAFTRDGQFDKRRSDIKGIELLRGRIMGSVVQVYFF